jgi:hypothetical protein
VKFGPAIGGWEADERKEVPRSLPGERGVSVESRGTPGD